MKLITRIFLFSCFFSLSWHNSYAFNIPFINNYNYQIILSDNEQKSDLKKSISNILNDSRKSTNSSDVEIDLNRQAILDKDLITKYLRSEGYYKPIVSYRVIESKIKYDINTGDLYKIKKFKIKVLSGDLDITDYEKNLSLKGKVFRADDVIFIINKAKAYTEKNYCFWKVDYDYDAKVYHHDSTAELTLLIKAEKEVEFGSMSINGLKSLEDEYVKELIGIKEGSCYKNSTIEKARLKLFKTGLFANVSTKKKIDGNMVDVLFDVKERQNRTIKAGIGVSSDDGIAVNAGWEHRNVLGKAQKLEANAKVSELFRTANASLTFPRFYNKGQKFKITTELSNENLEAFEATKFSVDTLLSRDLGDNLSGYVGVGYKVSSVIEDNNEELFGLVSFPVGVTYDNRKDILDPKGGWVLGGEIKPVVDSLDVGVGFLKSSVSGSYYYSIKDTKYSPVLAVRSAIGSLMGLNADDIPADERFYSGGGGSVRGFPFQKLGPLEGEVPIGGRSFAEISLETRFKFTKEWGGVVFLDGGNAYEEMFPELSDGFEWGVGAGARYYTDFAPIRLDIAVPVDKREGIDDAFQFYVSIGQAF